ncbi:MAG TPA: ABC transporter ATP-binding protein [Actinomycetota bacterium]
MNDAALLTSGLTKRYGEVEVVSGLDLRVERGELYGFLGPNGAGKTTTIRMALGLIHPTRGDVRLLGRSVSSSERSRALERTGAMIEEPSFYRFLSGRGNLEAFARAGRDRGDRRSRLARIDETLERVGLADAATKRVRAYSQGMRQRLGIALALLGSPEILVLDEPTNGLDPSGMREIRRLLRSLADDGVTVFVSSHLLGEVEAVCDRVGVLSRGRLVAEGPPSGLGDGGRATLRIHVDDVERAMRVLGAMPGVVASAAASGVSCTLSDSIGPADVNAALVGAGVRVSALVPERRSLEDVFLELVEDPGSPSEAR